MCLHWDALFCTGASVLPIHLQGYNDFPLMLVQMGISSSGRPMWFESSPALGLTGMMLLSYWSREEVDGQMGVEDKECELALVFGTVGLISSSVALSQAILPTQKHLREALLCSLNLVSLAVPQISFKSTHRPLTLVLTSATFNLSNASSISFHAHCLSRIAIFLQNGFPYEDVTCLVIGYNT